MRDHKSIVVISAEWIKVDGKSDKREDMVVDI